MAVDIAQAMRLFQSGSVVAAREICEQLLLGDPRHAAALQLLGAAHLHAKQLPEALATLNAAIEVRPGDPLTHNNLGLTYEYLGELAKAESCFRKALDLDPDFSAAYFNLSEVARLGAGDPHAARLLDLLPGAPARPETERSLLYFAAGKICAERHQHDLAFKYYEAANQAIRPEYDYHDHEQRIARTMAVFGREQLASQYADQSDATQPIFVVGMPRTGSSLVEQILASHPRVIGLGEMPLVPNVASVLGRHLDSTLEYPECIPRLAPEIFRRYAKAYRDEVSVIAPGAVRTVDKQLGNFAYLGLIALLFPAAKIVHVRRDPIDTCLSCYFRRLGSGAEFSYSLTDLGHHYRAYRRLMDHWLQVLPMPIHQLDYEGLVVDQETVSRNLLEFCELEWDDRCLAFHRTNRPVSTASAAQVRQPLYSSAMKRWYPYRKQLQPLMAALEGFSPSQ